MRKNNGFTLIELTIAIALSSIIALTLYSVLMQTMRGVFLINEKTSYQMMASTLYHQLEKDLYGACAPTQFLIQQREQAKQKEEKASSSAKPVAPAQSASTQNSSTPTSGVKEKEKKIPLLKKVFYATSEKNSFKQLTFITRNALAFYTDKDQKDITPLMVRVMYQLKPDEQNEGLFRLMRTQGTSLDPQDYDNEKKMRSYELASGIKEMKLIFYKQIPQKNESDDKKKDDDKSVKLPGSESPAIDVPKSDSSMPDTSKEQDEKKSAKQPKQFSKVAVWSTDELENGSVLLPAFVEVEIIFASGVDAQGAQLEEKERFMFEIAVSDMALIDKSLPDEPKDAPGKQPAAANAKDGQNGEKIVTQSLRPGARPSQQSIYQRQGYGPRGYQAPKQQAQSGNQKAPAKTTTTFIKRLGA